MKLVPNFGLVSCVVILIQENSIQQNCCQSVATSHSGRFFEKFCRFASTKAKKRKSRERNRENRLNTTLCRTLADIARNHPKLVSVGIRLV
jgi:hypothetical protein